MKFNAFTIQTGEELFGLKELPPPEPRDCIALSNSRAFAILAARIKARHHDEVNPDVRASLVLVMRWLDEATNPPKTTRKADENEPEKEDDE